MDIFYSSKTEYINEYHGKQRYAKFHPNETAKEARVRIGEIVDFRFFGKKLMFPVFGKNYSRNKETRYEPKFSIAVDTAKVERIVNIFRGNFD